MLRGSDQVFQTGSYTLGFGTPLFFFTSFSFKCSGALCPFHQMTSILLSPFCIVRALLIYFWSNAHVIYADAEGGDNLLLLSMFRVNTSFLDVFSGVLRMPWLSNPDGFTPWREDCPIWCSEMQGLQTFRHWRKRNLHLLKVTEKTACS